jgi:glycerol-3-phosphate O-acyltransferase
MGKIYFDFGEPVVLPEVPSPEDPRELQRVAFAVGVAVNRVTPITLPSLLCMVLLGAAPRALTADELERATSRVAGWASKRGIRLTDNLERRDEAQISELIDDMVATGLLTRYDDGPERVYTIAAEQHGIASYYRNTVIHYFVNKSIAELALLHMAQNLLTGAAAFWEEAERLRDLFKFEFFYAPRDEFRRDIQEELSRYQPRWEAALDEEGFALSLFTRLVPLSSHTVLLPFVEAYRVVGDVLARQTGDVPLSEKDCIQQALAYGRQAYLQRRISSEASIGKVYFGNGYKLADNFGLVDGPAAELENGRREFAQGFRALQRRLEQVRAAALPN